MYQPPKWNGIVEDGFSLLCAKYIKLIQGNMISIKDSALLKKIITSRYCLHDDEKKMKTRSIINSCAHSVSLLHEKTEEALKLAKFQSTERKEAQNEELILIEICQIIISTLYIVSVLEDIADLFGQATLERIRYCSDKGVTSEEMLYEYTKRWNAYCEAIQTIDVQFASFNTLFNQFYNSIQNTMFHPIIPIWSVSRMMAISWKANVLNPLVEVDKIDSFLLNYIHRNIMKDGVPPQNSKSLINAIIVDINCNESNVLYLGHSSLFNPDKGMLNAKNIMTDIINKFKDEVLTHGNDNYLEAGLKYIEQIKTLFPISIERSLVKTLLIHIEAIAEKRLFEACKRIFMDLKEMQGDLPINNALIIDDLSKINISGTLGNVINKIVGLLCFQSNQIGTQGKWINAILSELRKCSYTSVEEFVESVKM